MEFQEWLEDGYTSHAPVNTLRANGFGLHHVVGNVAEWCLDGFDDSFADSAYDPSTDVDQVVPYTGAPARLARGGGFSDLAANARSAHRFDGQPSATANFLGVRPARAITK